MNKKPYLGAFDVQGYLNDHHIKYWDRGKNISAGWIGIQCLWCDDHSNHLGINLSKKSINCHRCPITGTIIKIVMKISRVDYETACSIIRNYSSPGAIRSKTYSELLDQQRKSNQDAENKPKVQDLIKHYTFTKKMQKFHRDFLIYRRYDPEEILKKYNLFFGRPIGDYALRIIIPVTHQRRIVSFVARDATMKSNTPYANCPNEIAHMDIKETLYGLDECEGDTALVVEGILDKWRIGKNTVATYGEKYTTSQVELLRRFRRVFVLYDAEFNAQTNAQNLCNDLNAYVSEVIRLELQSGDPDKLSDNDVKHLRKQVFKKIY